MMMSGDAFPQLLTYPRGQVLLLLESLHMSLPLRARLRLKLQILGHQHSVASHPAVEEVKQHWRRQYQQQLTGTSNVNHVQKCDAVWP